jgi:hypothetical protein
MPRLLVTTHPLETMNMTEEKGCVAFKPQCVFPSKLAIAFLDSYQNVLQHFTLLLE